MAFGSSGITAQLTAIANYLGDLATGGGGGGGLTQDQVDTRVRTVAIGQAPTDLNTLEEIAASIGDDPAYATTVTAAIQTAIDAVTVDASDTDTSTFTGRLSTASDVQAALTLLDSLGIVNLEESALPPATAEQKGKLFIDPQNHAVYFYTEDTTAATPATGTFDTFSDASKFLGAHADHPASQVGFADVHIDKYYWRTSDNHFWRWARQGTSTHYYWVKVNNPASWLADRQSFDHSDAAVSIRWLSHRETDADLLLRVPDDFATGSRAYGFRESDNVIRFIDGSDYTASTDEITLHGYSSLAVPGISAVTQATVEAEVEGLLSDDDPEDVGTASAGSSTKASRSDHTHGGATGGEATPLSDDDPEPPGTAAAGDSTSASRSNHVHASDAPTLSDADPEPTGTAAAGSSESVSRADHVHASSASGGGLTQDQVDARIAAFGGSGIAATTAISDAQIITGLSVPEATIFFANLNEDIDENALYEFRFVAPSRPNVYAVTSGKRINELPARATTPTVANFAEALELKLARPGDTDQFSDFAHSNLVIWKFGPQGIWLLCQNTSGSSNTLQIYKRKITVALPTQWQQDGDIIKINADLESAAADATTGAAGVEVARGGGENNARIVWEYAEDQWATRFPGGGAGLADLAVKDLSTSGNLAVTGSLTVAGEPVTGVLKGFTRWLHGLPSGATQPTAPWDHKQVQHIYPNDIHADPDHLSDHSGNEQLNIQLAGLSRSRWSITEPRKFILGDVYASSNGDNAIDGVTILSDVSRATHLVDAQAGEYKYPLYYNFDVNNDIVSYPTGESNTTPTDELLANTVFELAAGQWEIIFDAAIGWAFLGVTLRIYEVMAGADDRIVYQSKQRESEDATNVSETGVSTTDANPIETGRVSTGIIKLATATKFYAVFQVADRITDWSYTTGGYEAASLGIGGALEIRRY